MTQKDGQERMAWLIDYRGWSFRKAPPLRQSLEVLNILQNHYPERLGVALSYDPPHIFQTFWKVSGRDEGKEWEGGQVGGDGVG